MDEVVLIVDDNEDARNILDEAVGSMGYATQQAADGPQALAIAREQPPALVLLDVMMPGMSGLQVLMRLRAIPALRLTPVIIITASGVADVDPARLPGPTRLLQKASYSINQLETMIGEMLTDG